MKTMKKLLFSTISLFLYIGFLSGSPVQGSDLQKTYTWKYAVNMDGNVELNNYDCNITIHTWDKGETEFHLAVDATLRSEEDAATLDKYLQNMKFSNSAALVSFKDSFWETRNSIMGKMTMKLEGGKTVSLTQFSMKGELWIPLGCKFELQSKYSEINMEDFSGQLTLDLYNDNFYGGNLTGKADITDKYSTMEFKELKDVRANLYNSKFNSKSIGDLKIESKYSKFTTVNSGILDISSYNDKYNFVNVGNITFVAKYSDLRAEIAGQVNLNCYEGSVTLKEAKDMKIISKYADFQFGKADNITITSTYNDKLVAEKLISLRINESKYCSFRISELINTLTESDGYEDKFTIVKAGQEFKELNVAGKYVEISLGLPKTIDFRFKAKIEYAKLDMDESVLSPKIKISKGSSLEYDAVKGTDKEGMPLIEVNGYQMSLKIIGL